MSLDFSEPDGHGARPGCELGCFIFIGRGQLVNIFLDPIVTYIDKTANLIRIDFSEAVDNAFSRL